MSEAPKEHWAVDAGLSAGSQVYAARADDAHGVQAGSGNTQNNYFQGGASVEWPLVVGRAPLTADAFQERADLADDVEQTLTAGSPVITQVAVGDGGTGKTQLAASLFRKALPGLDIAVWVPASNRSAILSAYAQAWARLHPGKDSAGDAEADAAKFANWLDVTDRAWMVVLDDVHDPADVRGLWPTGPAGRSVVTTRRRDPALTGHGRRVVEVDVFTPGEATGFLARKLATSRIPGVLDEADELAEDLGRLPLALAQAGAVILDEGLTCSEYRSWFADRTRRLADLFATDPGDEYEHTVASTWSLATDRADGMHPVGLAGHVLRMAGVLDPNGAPETAYTTSAALTHFTRESRMVKHGPAPPDAPNTLDGATALISGEEVRRALRNLHRLSLITHDPTDQARAVRMHALAQRATLEKSLASAAFAITNTVRAAADALIEVWPDVDRDGDVVAALRANTAVLASHDADGLWHPRTHAVLFKAGRSLGEAGQVVAARDHFADLVRTAEACLSPGHPDILAVRHQLAYWEAESGDPASAATALEQLLTDYLPVVGPDHPDILIMRHEIARWRGKAGDPTGAATALEQLLTDYLRVLGPDHPETLSTRHTLAYWRGKAGNPASAATALEQLHTDRLRTLGPDHPETLDTRHNLARWWGKAGDPARAATALEQLLTDRLRVLGPDHPETLDTRHEIAHWRGRAEGPTHVAATLQQLLTDHLRVLGPDHPKTLDMRHTLAYWQGKAGDPEGAATSFERLLTDRFRVVGQNNPHTLTTRHELARWQGEAGDPTGAATALEQLLTDDLRVLGPDHPETLDTRHQLAHWRGKAGDPGGAATALERLLSDQLRVLGPDHPHTLATRQQLAYWRAQTKHVAAAHRPPADANHDPADEADSRRKQ